MEENGIIVSYETYESGYFLDHVSSFLRKKRSLVFQGKWMLIAYWDAVHRLFSGISIGVGKNLNCSLWKYVLHRRTHTKQF